jgi:diaminopimelate decarboxylase
MALTADVLAGLASSYGTPVYVYDGDVVSERFARLKALFGAQFGVSYAVKANPNLALLRHMAGLVETFDVSSYKEVERVLSIGFPAEKITFSGPAKRPAEIRGAIAQGVGELVLESLDEARLADRFSAELGVRQPMLVRINPLTSPKKFGVNFSGRASQFGVDEEKIAETLPQIAALPNLDLIGFHIYSGTNSLDPGAIAENFTIFIDLFRRAADICGLSPRKLVFGSGFGIPYGDGLEPLNIEALSRLACPLIDELKASPRFAASDCVLEMGRWLVGPAGWLLTSVVAAKASRGVDLRLCDAGFNNHLAAFGLMGTVIRRNWPIRNVSRPDGPRKTYTLMGPLCTSIDLLATAIELPEVAVGDVLAIENSGAYGLTSSPTRFISHPEPAEVMLVDGQATDVTESDLNHWRDIDKNGVLSPSAERSVALERASR